MVKSSLAAVLVIMAYFSFCYWQSPESQLKSKYDLCFIEDTPGATEDLVTYTPYICSDTSKKPIGEALEGNWGTLSNVVFIDATNFEITVESDRPFYDGTCIPETKTIFKGRLINGSLKFEIISETETPGPC